jgi:hypothetical protein
MKKFVMPAKPASRPTTEAAMDSWVTGGRELPQDPPTPVSREATKRLTFDVPESVHRRVMSQCAAQGLKMTTVMRELIDARFPEDTEKTA